MKRGKKKRKKEKKSKHKTLVRWKAFLVVEWATLSGAIKLHFIDIKVALQSPDMIIQLNFLNKYHKQNSCSDVPTQF